MTDYSDHNLFYVSTPNADEFRDATATLVLTDASGDAWTTAHSIIDGFVSDDVVTITAAAPIESVSTISRPVDVAPVETPRIMQELIAAEEAQGELAVANLNLRNEIDDLRNTIERQDALLAHNGDVISTLNQTLLAAQHAHSVTLEKLASAVSERAGILSLMDEEGVALYEAAARELTLATSLERDVGEHRMDIAALQKVTAVQRTEFEGRIAKANEMLNGLLVALSSANTNHDAAWVNDTKSRALALYRDGCKVEEAYHRDRSYISQLKRDVVVKTSQIKNARDNARDYLTRALFAFPAVQPPEAKMSASEKLLRANIETMED